MPWPFWHCWRARPSDPAKVLRALSRLREHRAQRRYEDEAYYEEDYEDYGDPREEAQREAPLSQGGFWPINRAETGA